MLAVDMVADSSFGPASLPIVVECKLLAGWLRQERLAQGKQSVVACLWCQVCVRRASERASSCAGCLR